MATMCVRQQVNVLGGLSTVPESRLSAAARRALAYLAVRGPVVQRSLMSMHLWPSVPESHARANLRRAIWQAPRGLIGTSHWEVWLKADADIAEARRVARLALADVPLDAGQLELLSHDVLPGWYDEWLLDEQDGFHLIRLQALEAMCRSATRLRQYGLATRAGLAAVCGERLRQSAVVALIEAHLEEGNQYEALRRYTQYRELLRDELGIEPGRELTDLMAGVSPPRVADLRPSGGAPARETGGH